ncbi:P27 family phage terminase small subunit [Bacillus thuringiensis]|uniref:P27 family phage terminase small subunit n=2 Tax=Bacillus thuringiensis TaxID=1428 RepID=UPI0011557BB2|nr:P27 family phage terminase small subunit [Bacillus thuringiensis]EKS8366928.1 P27 family phage terminase small subunit [Bacillus cereus]EKS8368155.1 P27 family phage terminase small subunit [Bacillus cereus]MBG9484691.1 terminase small subunit [Bacillus thuringiensis]MBG9496169.1 terminase small subunit [Bacillus thuringiensis]MBG9504948.1 terminase small subunit [Bacillus thuringiensis]
MARMPKKKKIEMLDVARDEERKGIVNLLTDEGKFTPSLEPLIENYLDAFIIYKTMFEEWKADGFSPTKTHKNKAGAVNEMKHPLAQQVETWNDKKNKMLEALGMTNKGKSVQKTQKNNENIQSNEPQDELAAHREKWRKSK